MREGATGPEIARGVLGDGRYATAVGSGSRVRRSRLCGGEVFVLLAASTAHSLMTHPSAKPWRLFNRPITRHQSRIQSTKETTNSAFKNLLYSSTHHPLATCSAISHRIIEMASSSPLPSHLCSISQLSTYRPSDKVRFLGW